MPPAIDMPDPLREQPPADRFCDVVLNGGVASGVVYPWALLQLARRYRFRRIGGNSVGAMAAALAAAAEYGRCRGFADAFEPLRYMPVKLAEEEGGQTKMLRLFAPARPVRRLFELFVAAIRVADAARPEPQGSQPQAKATPLSFVMRLLGLYGFWLPLVPLLLVLALVAWRWPGPGLYFLLPLGLFGALLLAAAWVARGFYRDLGALAANGYGLCTGRGQGVGQEGLVEWLHRGIQMSAGRLREDPPLTFADLWAAPRFGRAGPAPRARGLQPDEAGIDLQMFTSNITQGRPVRLPLNDANTRLYFDPEEWKTFFQPTVLDALVAASQRYTPQSASDPRPEQADPAQRELMARLFELPSGDMPIVVAARMSLCFPVLFSSVPVYAVDYEGQPPPQPGSSRPPPRPEEARKLRKCLLSDGGLCTNFPVHLFDAAHPRWPTFAMLLDRRLLPYYGQEVWLPLGHVEGRADNWQRHVPGAEDDQATKPLPLRLLGFAGGLLLTMKDWNDRVTGRLPHVRNRIIRMALKPGEGQLNIAMPAQRILSMAHRYGTKAGNVLVQRFAPDEDGGIKPSWRQQVYVRAVVELRALRRHLRGYSAAVAACGDTLPLRRLLDDAQQRSPLLRKGEDEADLVPPEATAADAAGQLTPRQRAALEQALAAVETLEAELGASGTDFGSYRPTLEPELRIRPPI